MSKKKFNAGAYRERNLPAEERIKMLKDTRDNALEWFCDLIAARQSKGTATALDGYKECLELIRQAEQDTEGSSIKEVVVTWKSD